MSEDQDHLSTDRNRPTLDTRPRLDPTLDDRILAHSVQESEILSAPPNPPYDRDLTLDLWRSAAYILRDPFVGYDNHKKADARLAMVRLTLVVRKHVRDTMARQESEGNVLKDIGMQTDQASEGVNPNPEWQGDNVEDEAEAIDPTLMRPPEVSPPDDAEGDDSDDLSWIIFEEDEEGGEDDGDDGGVPLADNSETDGQRPE